MANQFTNSGATIKKSQGLFSQIGSLFGSNRNTSAPVAQPNVIQSILGKPATPAPKVAQAPQVKPVATAQPVKTTPQAQTGVIKAPVSQNLPSTATYTPSPVNTTPTVGMINLGDNQPKPYTNDSSLFGEVVTGLANTPVDNKEINEALKNREALQNEYQKNNNLIQSRGWDLSEQGGAQGMLKASYNTASAAAEDRVQNALTAQANQISALDKAGNLSRPITGVDPATGVYSPNTNKFLQNANPFVKGQMVGQQNQGEDYIASANTYNQSQDSIKSISDLLNLGKINRADITAGNKVAAWLSGEISDPAYQQLATYINDYLGKIAPVVGTQASTDYKAKLVNGMVNANMNPEAILQQINGLNELVYNIVQRKGQVVPISGNNNSNNTGGNMFGSFFQ